MTDYRLRSEDDTNTSTVEVTADTLTEAIKVSAQSLIAENIRRLGPVEHKPHGATAWKRAMPDDNAQRLLKELWAFYWR